jgi:flavodoxin
MEREMDTCVIYDSLHGNTEKIARAIGSGIGEDVPVLPAGGVTPADLEQYDLLIVGAPTHGGRPKEALRNLLNDIPASIMVGKRVAAFDTRVSIKWVRIFGYAAPRIARKLKKMGVTLVGEPEGFFVSDTEGPLLEGELERAAEWGRQVTARGR